MTGKAFRLDGSAMRAFLLFFIFAFTFASANATENLPYEAEPLTIAVDGQVLQWRIELADEQPERSKGLMFRQSMAPKTGMLFRFDAARPVMMWMKNTFIPLDMLFADDGGSITHIRRQAEPESLDIISSRGPVRYVFEINGGEAERLGLQIGQRLVHPAISP
ncbi:conserved hypothetical protein [Ahrensia sp. R2A130]|nr:conserved hypothetical protein [Ahrensia sp. R2A130]